MTLFIPANLLSGTSLHISLPALPSFSFNIPKCLLISLLLLGGSVISMNAATYTATQSGNWNAGTTWGGAGFPIAGDIVNIPNNYTIALTTAAACKSLTFSSGVLALGANNLTVSGDLTFPCNPGLITATTGYVILNGTTQTITPCSGAGTVSIPNLRLINSTQVSISPQGNLTITGNLDCQSGSSTFTNNTTGYAHGILFITGTCTAPNCTFTVTNSFLYNAIDFSGCTSNPIQVGTVYLNVPNSTVTFGTNNVLTTSAFSGAYASTITAGTVTTVVKQYKSIQTGSWSNTTTWNQSIDNGANWTAATTFPTSSDGLVAIINGYTVTLTGNATASKINITSGTLDAGTNTLTGSGAGTLAVASTGTLIVGGTTNFPTGFTTALSAGSTVNYDNNGAQTVSSQSYSNLILSGSGAKTLLTGTTTIGGNLSLSGSATTSTVVGLTIGGNLNIGDGTTFTAAGFSLTVNGTTFVGAGISGTLSISSATGNKTFTGGVTINSGGAITESAAATLSFGSDITINLNGTLTESGAALVGIAGNLTNSGTYKASTGAHTFLGTGKTIIGDGGDGTNAHAITIPNATFTGSYTNSCTYLNIPTFLTITGTTLNNNSTIGAVTITGSGGLTQGTGAILSLSGSSLGLSTLTATAANNTVNYFIGNQTVYSTSYYYLTLSIAGTKTAVSGLTVLGDLTIGSGTTFIAGAFTHNVAGNWTNNGSFTNTGSVINFNGSSAQTIGGSSSTTFNNLSLSGTASVTTGIATTVGGNLNIGDGTTLTVATAYPLTVTGITTVGNGTSGTLAISSAAGTLGSQVILNGGTISTAGIVAGTTITNSATLQIAANSGIILGSNTHSLIFANSSAIPWTGTLTITGWTGTSGTSGGGIGGRIFVGTSGLTTAQLALINFTGYANGAEILSTGEIVPTTLSISPLNLDFGYISSGSTSANLTFTIIGSNLSGFPGFIAVTAPTGFAVSLSPGSGFGASISVPYASSTLSDTIYVHFIPTGAAINFSSNITTNTVAGATPKKVAVTGTSINPWAFWFKADMSTQYTNNGTWKDNSINANNAVFAGTGSGTTTYADNTINFNPSITFTGIWQQMLTQSTTVQSFVIVTLPSTTNNHLGGLIGATTDYGIRLGASTSPYDWVGDPNNNSWAFGGLSSINGVAGNQFTNWHIVNQTRSSANTSQYYLGGYLTGYSNRFYSGSIAEIMAFPGSVVGQNAVESYLAIKYGITLGHDYIAGFGGATVYPVSGYGNDIAGLGNDITYGLNQKVSTSVNVASGTGSRVIMSTTNDFASSNLAGTRTSLTNGQYLIWGHNGAVTNVWNAAGIPSADNVINRVWQVQNTKSVGSVYFQIDLNAYPALQGAAGTFALMVNNSTNFSSGTTLYMLTYSGTGKLYYVASGVTFPTGTSYFTIGQRKFWVGNSGTAWTTAANWSTGSIPIAGTNVEFATASNNGAYPAVSNWVLDNDYTIGNLTNVSNQQLIIPPGFCLTVNGTITTANANNIYIRSAQGQANGSFIFPNATNVLATVEMYSKAHSIVTGIQYPSGTGPFYRFSWQYFGIPVDSITASPTFDGSYVRSLNEAGTTITNHWVQLNNLSKLAPFYGYEMTQDVTTGKLIVFQGHLKNKNWTSPLQGRTGTTGVLFPGQYLFANPYTAAIDIQKFISRLGSDTGGSVYLYSTGSLNDWGTTGTQGKANGTSAGQYQVVTSATGTGIPTQIPSMQAVLVQMAAGNQTGSTVTFNYSDVIKNTDFQRVKSNADVSAPAMSYTMIDINGSGYSDRMWIFSGSTFTHRYDRGWDGPKLMGIELAPQLYALEQDGNYQIDCVDDMNNTVLGFQRGVDTVYTLTFTHQNLSGKYAGIYLADLVENKTVDITQSGSTYSFVADSTSTPVKRFLILTRGIENVATNAELKLFNSGNSIFIQNSGNQNGELVIYDMMGRSIKKATFGPYGVTVVKTGAVPGAYVVNAATGTERVNKKVIIGE